MGNPKKPTNVNEDLHMAARSGDLNKVQSICSSNPLAINSRDKHSRTPLHLAAWSGQTQVASYLCNNKADVGAAAMDDMGAIHFAAQKGHLEVVKILLSSGVSVKASNRKGMTPLHYAVQGSHLELAKYLVKKGANLNAKSKSGKTPLDFASSDEVRLQLVEWERAPNKRDLNDKEKDEKDDLNSTSKKQAEHSSSQAAVDMPEAREDKGELAKRKVDEDDIKENLSEPKKAKVALNHLLAEDDTQEEEDNVEA